MCADIRQKPEDSKSTAHSQISKTGDYISHMDDNESE